MNYVMHQVSVDRSCYKTIFTHSPYHTTECVYGGARTRQLPYFEAHRIPPLIVYTFWRYVYLPDEPQLFELHNKLFKKKVQLQQSKYAILCVDDSP